MKAHHIRHACMTLDCVLVHGVQRTLHSAHAQTDNDQFYCLDKLTNWAWHVYGAYKREINFSKN